MSAAVIFPNHEKVLDHVVRVLDEASAHARASGAELAAPPTRARVDELITLAFAASLEHEEGRTVAFTFFYDDAAQAIDYTFKEPLSLGTLSLARLSAALDPTRTHICVRAASDGGLAMVGFHHWGDRAHSARGGSEHFAIRVLGPGVLVVRYRQKLVLTYRRGEVAYYPSDYEWRAHKRRALALPVVPELDDEHNVQLHRCVVHVAESMLQLGHGGALLILPDGLDWRAHVASCAFDAVEPSRRVRDAELADQHAQRPGDFSARSRLSAELDWLARLTATDGMTVIRPDLTLLAFGVFFRMEEPVGGLAIRVVDPYAAAGKTHSFGDLGLLGGARHQSAAVTARDFPGATAIVASQDGSLSAMRWDPDERVVLIHRHLELLFHL